MKNNVINVGLYGGKGIFSKKETPLEASVVTCDMCHGCSYYKDKTCLNIRSISAIGCQFGQVKTVKGYTSKSKNYINFRKKWEEHEAYNQLSTPATKKLGLIGNTVVFPYSYITIIEEDGKIKLNSPVFMGKKLFYIPLEKFTPELIFRICSFKPSALMGGVISAYQEEVVPSFIAHLNELLPNLYREFITQYPEYDKEISHIGREALLSTIMPSIVHYKSSSNSNIDETWKWDGEFLHFVEGHVSSFFIDRKAEVVNIKIKPSEKATIIISDNAQVNTNTVFLT